MAKHGVDPDGGATDPTDAETTVADVTTDETTDAEATDAEVEPTAAKPESETDADADADDDDVESKPARPRMSPVRLATIIGLAAVVALAGLTGWLGYRAYESRKAADERNLFLQVGRQGALNLTTIDFEHADSDVQRILDSATGSFYDDFQARSAPFVQVVKQAKSKSVGNITEAGVESESGDNAAVLVAVTVKTSNAGAAEQDPRSWRMRITVQKMGDQAKVSNVEFVP
ncbi:MAG: Mce-associated rane protein [Mycobacterium sp.]|jgi:Mce-associated membrane protein|nr:Mce-associated rane protein [Mycobacterium sp.]